MKKIVVLMFTLFMFACSGSLTPTMFPEDFDTIRVFYPGGQGSQTFLKINTANLTFTFSRYNGDGNFCTGSFAVLQSEIDELRDLVADIEITSGDGSFSEDTQGDSFYDAAGVTVNGEIAAYTESSCNEGTCDTILASDYELIKDFLFDLLEDSGLLTNEVVNPLCYDPN